MNKTTLSIAISLALLGGNAITPAVVGATTLSSEIAATTERAKPSTTGGKPDKPAKPDSEPTGDEPDKPAKGDKPGKKPPKSNPKLEALGIQPEDIQDLDATDVENLSEEAIEAFDEDNIADLSPAAISGLTPKQIGKIGKKGAKGLKKEQIVEIPPEVFAGFTGENLGGLDGEAVQAINEEQLLEITDETAEELSESEEDAAEVLANLDPELLEDVDLNGDSPKAKKIKKFIPPGWIIGNGNILKRPIGAIIVLPTLPAHSAAALKITGRINLDVGTGVGGSTGEDGDTVLDDMNELVEGAGFTIDQTEDGTLLVEGEGLDMAFAADPDGMEQGDEDATPGIGMNEEGQYVLTLGEGEQIAINPAPADPEGLADVLPDGSEVEIGENAQALITLPDEEEDAVSQIINTVFAPLVTEAPEDLEPGIHIEGEGVDAEATMVYENGTAQEVNPAMQSPEQFQEVASQLDIENIAINDVTTNADGTVTLTITISDNGIEIPIKVNFIPDFEITPASGDGENDEPTTEDDENTVEPTIGVNEDGELEFVNEDGNTQEFYMGDIEPVEGEGDEPPPPPPVESEGDEPPPPPPVEGEGDGTADEGDGTVDEGDGTADEGDGTADEGDGTADEGDGTADEGDGTADEGDGTADEGDGTVDEGDGTADEGDGTADEGDGTADEGDGTADEGDGTADEGDGTADEGDGTVDEGDGTVDEGDGTADEGDGAVDEGDGTVDEGDGTADEGDGTVDEGDGTVDEGDGTAA